MDVDRLGDDVADLHARIERAVGVLEDHLNPPAQAIEALAVEVRQVCAIERISPAVGRSSCRMQRPVRGLAATGLADEAERLAAANVEAHAVDRLDVAHCPRDQRALGDRKVHLQPADADEAREAAVGRAGCPRGMPGVASFDDS